MFLFEQKCVPQMGHECVGHWYVGNEEENYTEKKKWIWNHTKFLKYENRLLLIYEKKDEVVWINEPPSRLSMVTVQSQPVVNSNEESAFFPHMNGRNGLSMAMEITKRKILKSYLGH